MSARRPHVGVNLELPPEEGGAFQYSLLVLHALAPLADEGWKVTAFVADPRWRELVPGAVAVTAARRTGLLGVPAALARRLDRSCPGQRRAGRMDLLARAIDASGCDLAVFPAQESTSYAVRTPSLATIHDLMHRYEGHHDEYQRGEAARRDRHYRCVCETAAGILVDSDLGKRHVMESYGVAPERVWPVPFAAPTGLADAADVDVHAKYGLPDRYLFYPAQFWTHKNHLELLEAVALARSRGVDAKLVLCGAPKNGYARALARLSQPDLAGHVKVLGYVPGADVASLYRKAVATVFVSSLGPTNIPPLEAMMLGCPLVASNVYAMPEQIGDAGLLVDPKDPRDIADKIERIWTDEGLRRALAARGLARAARWTAEDFGRRVREIVESLVSIRR